MISWPQENFFVNIVAIVAIVVVISKGRLKHI